MPPTVAGIDGATKASVKGWVSVLLVDGRLEATDRHATFQKALDRADAAAAIAVDLPLAHEAKGPVRACDEAAWEALGPHTAELQPAPHPGLLAMEDHGEACALARERGWPEPDRLVWLRRSRILEVQEAARHASGLVEAHPELSFQVLHEHLGGKGHLRYGPSRWYGLHERLTLLHGVGLRPARSFGGVGKQGPEDVLAATVLAWTAMRVATGEAVRFPAEGGEDLPRLVA